MNILLVHDKPARDMGGMAHFIATQRALLERAGHRLATAVCAIGANADDHELPATGRRTGRSAYNDFDALIARHQPDVIHIHSGYYALGPWLLQRLIERRPVVYMLHDVTPLCPRTTKLTRDGQLCKSVQGARCIASRCYPLNGEGRLLSNAYGLLVRALQLHALRRLPSWIVPSRYLAGELQRSGIAAERIHVIPHFIAEDTPRSPVPAALRLLFVGRLVEEKGIKVLFEALQSVRNRWSLRIAGEGPLRGCVEREIVRRDYGDRVQLLSRLDRAALAHEYRQARVVVMPSLIPESFGLVGLEALAHARPVVGFCSGGMAEWLRHERTGLVAKWGSVASLAHHIDTLLDDHGLCQRLGDAGYDVVQREFRVQRYLPQLEAVFDAERAAFAAGVRT